MTVCKCGRCRVFWDGCLYMCVCVKAMEMFRHVCVCRGGGSEEAERAGNIYVFYSGKGGGVKSPDP